MKITVTPDVFKLARVFRISRGSRMEAKVLTVRVEKDGITGWGECVPYARYDETLESVTSQVTGLFGDITSKSLLDMLPAGAARNAVDCALWELKTKLGGGEEDVARIEAVRRGAPDARIIVDANEGWTPELYQTLAPVLVRLGVQMVEQPLPAGEDEALLELKRVLPVCADESCHDAASLRHLKGKYDMVNIKLDKTGGLTEALRLRNAALDEGYDVMVGCMVGSSLAMAPATILAQGAAVTDLDGPLLLAEDRQEPLFYDTSGVHGPAVGLWG